MKNNLVPVETAKKVFAESNLACVGRAGIREINKLARDLETASGVKFIHMEIVKMKAWKPRESRQALTPGHSDSGPHTSCCSVAK